MPEDPSTTAEPRPPERPGAGRSFGLLMPVLATSLSIVAVVGVALATLVTGDPGSGLVDDLRWLVSGGGRRALFNTVVWLMIVPGIAVTAALGLAWAAQRTRHIDTVSSLVMVPVVLAPTVVAVVWQGLVAFRAAGTDQVGLLNAMLGVLGFGPVAWLVQPHVNVVVLAGALVWSSTGLALLVLRAAVTRVPRELIDAARVDGATENQLFARVTVPTIKGAVVVSAAVTAVVVLRTVDLVLVATGGDHGTSLLGTASVQAAFDQARSARGVLVAAVLGLLVLPPAAVLLGRQRRYGAVR